MYMPRKLVIAVITQKHWQPYIKSHWMDFNKGKSGVIITFKGNEQHEYKCSHLAAREILSLGTVDKINNP